MVACCDSIDGPIVKLFNGSVRRIETKEEAKKIYPDVDEIIYLGDILFPFSDLANRNSILIRPGYVEEWWKCELNEKSKGFEKDVNCFNVKFDDAVELSRKYKIPLHPKFIYYWSQISKEQFLSLIYWLKHAKVNKKIIFPYNKDEQEKFASGKRALELLGVPHEVTIENVVLNEIDSKSIFCNIGLDWKIIEEEIFLKDFIEVNKFNIDKNVLEILEEFSEFKIKDKAGEFIGARMGRPEKAKLRKLQGSPHVLFPVGNEGGRLRSVQSACEIGKVKSSFPIFYCDTCKKETIYKICEQCGNKTKRQYYFSETKEKLFSSNSKFSEKKGLPYCFQNIDINHYLEKAKIKLGFDKSEMPLLIKGVRGTSSEEHAIENLAKGVLRAKYNLQVNKDGTIRFDCTELPLNQFKPKEIFVSIEKLKKLGYDKDIYGNDITDKNQIVELMPHDILLPCCPESPDERADDVFVKIANFVDDELVKFYGLEKFYNIKNRDDLIGHLGVCMAPHNCAGVVCRIIGFSSVLGLMATPYMHAAMRRDCDGDEAAVMLLGDVLLNFSRKFLPSHRGGTQDAPLVLNARIEAGEVDDQILDLDFVEGSYPLNLYELAEQKKHSSEVKSIVTCKKILKEGKDPFVGIGFTHDTSDFNDCVRCSSYKLLPTMNDKVKHQMALVEKIRAVDTSDTARLIIDRHFMRDIRGNLRKFSQQGFRCVACNEIMRRPPLSGVCPVCKGKIIFTIHEGGIKKYLELALELAKKYDVSPYMKQNLELVKTYIDSIFGKEIEKQQNLQEWFG